MKKILLLLSCCLATWCSVQAGTKASTSSDMMQSSSLLTASYGYGQIKSATFDKDNNTMFVTYSITNGSNAKLQLLQTRTGKIVHEYSLSVNANTTTFRVYTRASTKEELYVDEGLYVLLLVVDGNIRSNMNVQITAKGNIKSISPSLDNKKLTVSYAIEHASTYSVTLRIYDGGTQLKRISLPYPNTSNSYTFDSSSLEPGKRYRFDLYSGDNILNTKYYTMPVPTGELSAVSYSPDNKNSFTIDYTLKYARNPTVGIYDNGGTKLLKSVAITNSSTNKTFTVNNVVEPSNYYQVCICENGKKLTALKQLDTYKVTETNNSISSITYEKGINRILVQFSLKNTGVNVGFEVISTRTGKSYEHTYGRCDQYSSNRFIDLPSEDNGYRYPIIYVVLLKVDGKVVDSKQIAITR